MNWENLLTLNELSGLVKVAYYGTEDQQLNDKLMHLRWSQHQICST